MVETSWAPVCPSVTHFLSVAFNAAYPHPAARKCVPFVEHSRKEQDLFWIISEPSLTQPSLLAAPSPPQTPHFPPDSDLLLKAARTYHRFLTWPVPYCSICQELLTFIDAELKAPGKCGGSPHVGQGPHGQEVSSSSKTRLWPWPFLPLIPQLTSALHLLHNLGVPSSWCWVHHSSSASDG